MVVKDDEVADLFDLEAHFIVVLIDERLRHAAEGEEVDQPRDAGHDQMDAGGFEWFEEAARQSKRDHVLAPRLAAPPGAELDHSGLNDRAAFYVPQQLFGRFLVGHVATAIDEPVAYAML